ncbi:MAG TPA: BlaI/MecI/CopY family transcriptional regulator [Pirellulaceae bacterium]|nr:BlaI/MecI/CopY family transcriptional regulator [Pirellulaceae bacterium]HMO93062.1 BlaI/MecI/CopY family transcriptional regulator [Pirellulaceae bacterium]HMP69692.1 BlaI/MecI/CopY family transcriptional regulator [Pirellulaceae bacterium]
MNKRSTSKPTEAEMAILHVLWERGPSTVRQVQDALEPERGTGYTTTLKLMQIMFDKGLLTRDASSRSHIYSPAISRQKTQRRIVKELLEQVFAGSAQQLVVQALTARKSTPAELAEIRKLIDELEKGKP